MTHLVHDIFMLRLSDRNFSRIKTQVEYLLTDPAIAAECTAIKKRLAELAELTGPKPDQCHPLAVRFNHWFNRLQPVGLLVASQLMGVFMFIYALLVAMPMLVFFMLLSVIHEARKPVQEPAQPPAVIVHPVPPPAADLPITPVHANPDEKVH